MNPQNPIPTRPDDAPPAGSQFVKYAAKTATPPNLPTAPVLTVPSFVPPPPPAQRFGNISAEPPRRKGKWKAISIVLVIIIAVLVIGAIAAYAFILSPQKSLDDAFSAIDRQNTIHSTIVVSIQSDNKNISGSQVTVAADIDRTNVDLLKGRATIDLTSPSAAVSGEIRIIDGIIYGQLTRIPFLYSAYVSSSTVNHWYSLSLTTIEKLKSMYASSTDKLFSAQQSANSQWLKLQTDKIIGKPTLAGVGKEDNVWVKRYKVEINREAFIDFMTASAQKTMFKDLNIEPIIITSGLFSGDLKGISGAISQSAGASGLAAGTVRITVSAKYTDTQPGTTISAPTGATPLDQIILGSLDSAKQKGMDAAIQSNLSQARTQMEVYFKDTYKGGCSAPEMVKIISDVRTRGSVMTCRENGSAYIVAAPLPSRTTATSTTYYCLDSTGRTGYLNKIPSNYSCK